MSYLDPTELSSSKNWLIVGWASMTIALLALVPTASIFTFSAALCVMISACTKAYTLTNVLAGWGIIMACLPVLRSLGRKRFEWPHRLVALVLVTAATFWIASLTSAYQNFIGSNAEAYERGSGK